jgi:HAD superfamily hydrolase (TIGR01459 family)
MRIEGLVQIASQFDAMLIDQFGVIHDGQKLYPGALQTMQQLKRAGVPVVVLSNSGKRAAPNVDRIVRRGIARDLFVDCVSSGEVAWQSLGAKRAFLVGKRGTDYGYDPVQFVDITEAEIILILGSNTPETSLDDYRRFFADVKLPALCCNPDKHMITPHGLQPAPGRIADIFEQMGGDVRWIGKPYGEIYQHALKILGFPRRVLCIGDSAEHDVVGGRNAGLSTLLVMQGVSQGLNMDDIHPDPDFIMDGFRWRV